MNLDASPALLAFASLHVFLPHKGERQNTEGRRRQTRREAGLGLLAVACCAAAGCSRQAGASAAGTAAGAAAPETERTVVLEVPLLTSWEPDDCCAIPPDRLIPAVLGSVDGVTAVRVTRAAGRVEVRYHPARVRPERLARLLTDEGFPARVAAIE